MSNIKIPVLTDKFSFDDYVRNLKLMDTGLYNANAYDTVQDAINAAQLNGGGIIYIQDTYTENITISGSNIHLKGQGTIKGTISLYGDSSAPVIANRFVGSCNCSIEDITIDGETARNGINVKWYLGVSIKNVTIKNCLKAINFEQVPYSQHSARFSILGNHLIDCNYGLYIDYTAPGDGGTYPVGDITFSDNMYESRDTVFGNIYHIWGKGIDGLICKGNTLFFGHIGAEKSCIFLDTFNWVHIEGNQLFEAVDHGVRCENGNSLKILGNKFAWGQKQGCYINNCMTVNINDNEFVQRDNAASTTDRTGIYITSSPYFCGTINSNSIWYQNEYGIYIKDSSFITVNGNSIKNKYSVNEPVKLDTVSSCLGIIITANVFSSFTKKMETTYGANQSANFVFSGNYEDGVNVNRGVEAPFFTTYTSGTASVDIKGRNLIVFANSAPTTVTSLTTEDLSNTFTRLVTLFGYNGNTTLSRTIPNLVMKGAGDVTIPANESMTLLVNSGKIYEINRSFAI